MKVRVRARLWRLLVGCVAPAHRAAKTPNPAIDLTQRIGRSAGVAILEWRRTPRRRAATSMLEE